MSRTDFDLCQHFCYLGRFAFVIFRFLHVKNISVGRIYISDHIEPIYLDVPVHGGGLGGPDQPLQLGTAVVLGLGCQFLDVDVGSKQVEAAHLVGVNGQNLDTPLLIRQTWRPHEEAVSDQKHKDGQQTHKKT